VPGAGCEAAARFYPGSQLYDRFQIRPIAIQCAPCAPTLNRATNESRYPFVVATDIHSLHSENHVWFVNPVTVTGRSRLDACRSVLSADEIRRSSRFRFAEHRHMYLVSHALVRYVLSSYCPVAPQQWKFSRSERGKPEIANDSAPALRFNLTHTHGLAACIVALGSDCGIDAEHLSTRHNPEGIARRMFSQHEFARLQTLREAARLEYFYNCWTLREAYVKARGLGIAFPTRKLGFEFSDPRAVQARFDSDVDDDPLRWRFRLFRPTPEHILATASASPGGDVNVRLFEYIL
jgi:4'-phosphopantetheinyl transferase